MTCHGCLAAFPNGNHLRVAVWLERFDREAAYCVRCYVAEQRDNQPTRQPKIKSKSANTKQRATSH